MSGILATMFNQVAFDAAHRELENSELTYLRSLKDGPAKCPSFAMRVHLQFCGLIERRLPPLPRQLPPEKRHQWFEMDEWVLTEEGVELLEMITPD